jgi:hypothetical protein
LKFANPSKFGKNVCVMGLDEFQGVVEDYCHGYKDSKVQLWIFVNLNYCICSELLYANK